MKLKELIRQLNEYAKIYSPEVEVITQTEDDTNEVDFWPELIADGLDYIGDGKILITSHENE
jgi:hypothetical protein